MFTKMAQRPAVPPAEAPQWKGPVPSMASPAFRPAEVMAKLTLVLGGPRCFDELFAIPLPPFL